MTNDHPALTFREHPKRKMSEVFLSRRRNLIAGALSDASCQEVLNKKRAETFLRWRVNRIVSVLCDSFGSKASEDVRREGNCLLEVLRNRDPQVSDLAHRLVRSSHDKKEEIRSTLTQKLLKMGEIDPAFLDIIPEKRDEVLLQWRVNRIVRLCPIPLSQRLRRMSAAKERVSLKYSGISLPVLQAWQMGFLTHRTRRRRRLRPISPKNS